MGADQAAAAGGAHARAQTCGGFAREMLNAIRYETGCVRCVFGRRSAFAPLRVAARRSSRIARPCVGDADRHILAGLHVSLARAALVQPHVGSLDVSLPPLGMASRTLMHRFSTTFSSWFASHSVGQRPIASTVSTATDGPVVRRIRSSMPAISLFGSVDFGSSVCRRAKASSRCVSAAARLAAPCAATIYRSKSPIGPCAARVLSCSRQPVMAANRLLKSCASPPVSWPSASIFCAWKGCSRERSSSSWASRRSVRSRVTLASGRPAARRSRARRSCARISKHPDASQRWDADTPQPKVGSRSAWRARRYRNGSHNAGR